MICENCGHEQDEETEDPYAVVEGPLTEEETRWRESDTVKFLHAKLIQRSNLTLVARAC